MFENEIKDTYKYIHSDTATKDDALGFKSYVEAIAEFLTDGNTHAPLTLSIEGQWGCGKSSFMLQLKEEIKRINSIKGKKDFTILFNSWIYDKEDELWAAFALSSMDQLLKQLSWQDRKDAKISLLWQRFKLRCKSDSSFVIDTLWRSLCSILVIVLFIWFCYKIGDITDILFSYSKDDIYVQIVRNILVILAALLGLIGSIFSIFKNSKLLANPLDFIKFVQNSNYKERLPFIENFHSDFGKIIESYVGKARVYVFIDDVDRCEIPKAAELMKAINLMISDNPNIYFIIGMDRKLIAAGIASRQNEVVSYLTDDKLKYGYEFIEKFIQFPFKVPSPKNVEYKEFLFGKDGSKELIEVEKIKKFVLGEKTSKENTEEKIIEMEGFGGTDCYELSENFGNILKMVSPALDNNPRRLKQFHNMFRFHKYIGRKTGLFFRKGDVYNVWNCKKLAKFITISIMWPSIISELNFDRTLLDQLQEFALRQKTDLNKSEYEYSEDGKKLETWTRDTKLIKLLRVGCIVEGNISKDADEYTFSKLDFSKLLDVSPVGSFNIIKYSGSSNNIHVSKTLSNSNDIHISKEFTRSAEFGVEKVSANAEISQSNDEGKYDPSISGTDNQTANPVTILPLNSYVVGSANSTANATVLKEDEGNKTTVKRTY